MIILNFAHPLTDSQKGQIENLLGQRVDNIIEIKVQFDLNQDFVRQVVDLLDSLPVEPAVWEKEAWLILLPSLNYIAAVMLAELHGRMGHFPSIIRLRPANTLITEYEVAEIINLEKVRQEARARR